MDTERFPAFRIDRTDSGEISGALTALSLSDLSDGEVVIRVSHSSINYKDALAATGAGRILRTYPLVGGIDLAGSVESSTDSRFQPGDSVLVNGCGLSETRDGGYAAFARVPGDSVIPIPDGMDARTVMQLGTAGFTAALAIHLLEHNGLQPGQGPVLVNGATGGVGSVAIDMLVSRGYEVCALTGKTEHADYLRKLGASEVIDRRELDYGSKPMETARWAGAVDNLGGDALTWLTRTAAYGAGIACVGLAAGPQLQTTVLPLILRAVSLLGVNSVDTPRELRLAVWDRIATDLSPRHLHRIASRTVNLEELPGAFGAYLEGANLGRTVVEIGQG